MTEEMAREDELRAPARQKRPWNREHFQILWRGEKSWVRREINEVKE